MDKIILEQSLHIVINSEHAYEDKSFRQASPVLWAEISTRACTINAHRSDEMTSTLFSRLLNRRQHPFQPIANPNAYIYAALKNIQKDMWRAEKRVAGYTDDLGEYHQHRSLDEFVLDSTQRLHEKIAAPLMEDIEETEELQLSALKEMIRVHLFNTETTLVRSKTAKGAKAFQTAAQRFQEFAEGTYKITDSSPYKKFDRQRIIMLKHLEAKLPSIQSSSTNYIFDYVTAHDITNKRTRRIEDALKDETINPETVHRQIEAEIAIRSLFEYLESHTQIKSLNIQDLMVDPVASGLVHHCQYHLFKLEMFRTKKRKKGSLESMYCQNVQS